MDNHSNISDISDRSLSNFTHLSEDNTSQISDMGSINYGDLLRSEKITGPLQKLSFWDDYESCVQNRRFDTGFLIMSDLLEQIDKEEGLGAAILKNERGRKKIWQKQQHKAMCKCFMAQCLFLADGNRFIPLNGPE